MKIKDKLYFVWMLLTGIFLISCNNQSANSNEKLNNPHFQKDSIELTALVRNIYNWHVAKNLTDFPYQYISDSIFTGIDWDTYEKNIESLKKTNFFSQDFLTLHHTLALSIDSSMKKSAIEWRNVQNGIPVWNTNADDWCGCQDSPDTYWEVLILNDLIFNQDQVTFTWTWDKANAADPFKYQMKARKEEGVWKITYMEGFKYYGTVADYDKTMK